MRPVLGIKPCYTCPEFKLITPITHHYLLLNVGTRYILNVHSTSPNKQSKGNVFSPLNLSMFCKVTTRI